MPKETPLYQWPKTVPPLSEAQQKARDAFMLLWHQELPSKYSAIETFNHGYPAKLPLPKSPCRTLEIGAGLGEHASHENLKDQDYYVLEVTDQFCEALRKKFPANKVFQGDIHEEQPWKAGSFDRIVAVHVLEHLPNLPAALSEIERLLTPEGVLDIVIPCEGGLAHTLGRKISSERLFEKTFHMDFTPICKNEHVNRYVEIVYLLEKRFRKVKGRFFPLVFPPYWANFCAGFRFEKKTRPFSSES